MGRYIPQNVVKLDRTRRGRTHPNTAGCAHAQQLGAAPSGSAACSRRAAAHRAGPHVCEARRRGIHGARCDSSQARGPGPLDLNVFPPERRLVFAPGSHTLARVGLEALGRPLARLGVRFLQPVPVLETYRTSGRSTGCRLVGVNRRVRRDVRRLGHGRHGHVVCLGGRMPCFENCVKAGVR